MSEVRKFESVSVAELVARGLKPDTSDAPSSPATSTEPKSRECPVVLVVDDEPVIADTLAVILGNQGYLARSVYTGEEALDLATSTSPDLVITDVMMPRMSGIELGMKLKQLVPTCKVLLFSGHASALHDQLESVRQKGYDFTLLAKPVAPTVLLNEISKLGVPPSNVA